MTHTVWMPGGKDRASREVLKDLQALDQQVLVKVARTIRRSDRLAGFVVGIGKVWVLLALLDPNMYLNGFAAIRLRDISKVKSPRTGSFVRRALELRGDWPPVGANVDLDGTAELVRTAAELAPLVTLHFERDDPTVCFIGKPVRFTRGSVRLMEVDPQAEWEPSPSKWSLADVTRGEFAGRYEEALALVAGPPPE